MATLMMELAVVWLLMLSAVPATAQSPGETPVPATVTSHSEAPLSRSPGVGPADAWIAVLKSGHSVDAVARTLVRSHGAITQFRYTEALNGFAFEGPPEAVAFLRGLPDVLRVEPQRLFAATGDSASVGLIRIGGDVTYANNDRGRMPDGDQVRIAVLDSGVDASHPDLAPNLDLANSTNCIAPGTPPDDDFGHGTHVAGIAAAADNGSGLLGVGSQTTLVVAKVLNSAGLGSDAQIICGLDWVASLAADGIPTVVNLSLGRVSSEGPSCSSSLLHQAVCNVVDAGVTIVTAAGNDGADASTFVPTRYPETIAVSAFTDFDGSRAATGCVADAAALFVCDETLGWFSNYGSVIDVTAPGVLIVSTARGGGTETKTGTSMAAPFVAGVAALVLAADPTLNPAEVRAILQTTGECPDGATSGAATCAGHGQWTRTDGISSIVPDADGIPEPLVDAAAAAAAARPEDTMPPVVAVTAPAAGAMYEAGVDVVTASYSCTDPVSGVTSCTGDLPDGTVVDTSIPLAGAVFAVTGIDKSGNTATVTNTYDVVDTTPPSISLLGADPMFLDVGATFTDPGATVEDNVDATVTITGVSTVDTATAGTYSVTYAAADAAGNGAVPVVRTVVVSPLPPSVPRFVSGDPGDASVTVHWSPPTWNGGSPVTGYEVTAAPGGATCSAVPNERSCTVAALVNGTSYTFSVWARNAAGLSPAAVTAAVVPVAPPVMLDVVVVGGPAAVSEGVSSSLSALVSGSVRRIGGANRYDTAALLSASAFSPGEGKVYVATGDNFPDALTGGPAAAKDGAPILLVRRDAVPAETVAELKRLRPGEIVILGGEAAVSAAVETMLGSYTSGAVSRLAGSDRYGTAAAVSAATFPAGVPVFIATGEGFPDALAGSAAGAELGGPVLLTSKGSLPAATAVELTRLDPSRVYVLGGTAVISDAVVAELGAYASGGVIRLAGADRFATAAAVADTVFTSGVSVAYVATGRDYPDGIAAGPIAAAAGAPILLVDASSLPTPTRTAVVGLLRR